jgi:trehalose 6-phosphate phosphatase
VSEHLDDPTELATALGAPERYLVVLDFDGTLSPIVDRPGDAAPAA